MYKVPLNRWTVGIAAALLALFGGDMLAPLAKVIGALTAAYTPAM